MKLVIGCILGAVALPAADKKVKMTDLPSAVRSAVEQQLKGAEMIGLSREVEKGKTFYELETKVNGHSRDMLFDSTGSVTEIEEEVELAVIPAAAREALLKMTPGAKIARVEALSKGGTIVAYEAAVEKGKKKSEVAVTPAGAPYKD